MTDTNTKVVSEEVRQYLDGVPEDRKPLVEKLHRLIVELYPQVDIDLSYRMPTYRAKEGWVAIANQQRYVSLYTCGAQHIADFKQQYPSIRTGKGCINLSRKDPVPLEALSQVIIHAIEHPK